jgi:NitT/TauT family transport system substrate-binding protein
MRSVRIAASLAAVTMLATMAAACGGDGGGSGGAGEQERLQIGFAAPNQVYSAAYVAMSKGFFAEQRFQPQVVITQTSSGAVQQAASGSVQLAAGTPDAALLGINQGAAVSVIATTIKGSPLSVVTRSNVRSWAELRGKTIGVSALKGGEIALLRRLLAANGLRQGDYDVVVSGATPAKAAALRQGSIVAAVLFSPTDYALRAQGFRILGSTASVPQAEQIPLTVYFTNKEWAKENEHGLRVARALVKANRWLQDPANRDEAVRIFAAAAKQQPQHVAATYKLWFDDMKIGTPDGRIDRAEIQNVIDLLVQDGDIKAPLPTPDKFIDTSFMDAAAR